ncbi:MAG: hypothetical protein E7674_05645 [Ruminococcaceae bacterium]|nr:hypothetical protein [Oscillospiraceae bacterium]MBQ3599366.1 hypothetical protein [Clostridia bacterium]MBR2914604.1 hypothetical protein [Clostridia bacterium]
MNNRKPTAMSKRSGETIKPSLSVGTDAGINSVHRPKTGVNNVNVRKKRNMVAVREVPIRTERKKDRAPLPIGVIFTAIIFTALFSFMIINYAEIDRYNSELGEMDQKIADLKHEQDILEQKLEQKDDLTYICNYAENELGMVKYQNIPSKHVKTEGVDAKSEVIVYDDEENGLGVMLSGMAEAFREFFN